MFVNLISRKCHLYQKILIIISQSTHGGIQTCPINSPKSPKCPFLLSSKRQAADIHVERSWNYEFSCQMCLKKDLMYVKCT